MLQPNASVHVYVTHQSQIQLQGTNCRCVPYTRLMSWWWHSVLVSHNLIRQREKNTFDKKYYSYTIFFSEIKMNAVSLYM